MKQLFAIAVPVLPGQDEAWKSFINELITSRKQQFTESRQKMGVRERTFFQSTPMGGLVLVTLEGENPMDAFATFGKGEDDFTKWFVAQVKTIHGIDLAAPPEFSMSELIADSGKLPEPAHAGL
ncbi:hypothetical protein ACTHGU_01015 [Chitinophagaceae bacterium MMS25-I14]